MASFSSSSLTPSAKYDVFLSFRGEDTRRNFISHLYAALSREKIKTFADDEGSTISPSLLDAIKGSKISAIIFSKGYVSSRRCLGELEKIMECKKKYNQIVIPVFYDVAPSDVRASAISLFKKEEGIKDELEEVKGWMTALIEALTLTAFDSTNDRSESVLVDKIVKYIWLILNDNKDLFIEQSTIEKIESLLCIGSKDVCTIGIWGLSGIGKTTIAKVVFDKIKYEFDNSYFAQNVREESESPYGLTTLRQELLFEILEDQHSNLSIFIKQRLNRKRILIVFDDVTSLKQIKTLIGDLNYLGVGSRVIITTRDRQVLKNCGVNKSKMYKVEPLCDPAALQLFSWHAFQDTNPIPAYSELSNRVVKYAKGVPLALKVLGSFLRDKKRKVWESAIDKLKGIPYEDIQEVLRLGYEGLDDDEKNIFLDIACFLKGDDRDFVINLLNASGFFAEIGVSVLKNKSLITFSKNRITMPHLLQEIGREVVREESSKDLRRHTRLWHHMDILQVLEDDLGTKVIEGVCLDMLKTTNDNLNPHAFAKMHNLRYLKVYNKHLKEKNTNKFHASNSPESVLTELRYLCWHGYPLKLLQPNFHPENLVSLDLSNSIVEELWTGDQNLKLIHLKSINLSHSKNLIKSPDLSCTPNLESLILEGCTSLIEISPSITRLNKLAILNLRDCNLLPGIPGIPSRSLRKVFLSSCSNLKDFPNISCNTEELFLDETAIKEILPQSIKDLSRLVVLNLENCLRLKSFPSDIYKLKSLEHLNLSGCPELDGLTDSVGKLEALKVLKARGSARIAVPSFIVYLCFLVELNLMNCFISKLPDDLGNLLSLESLVLAKNNFELIPPSIVGLSKLSYLDLGYCQNLQSLPELPRYLQYIAAYSCTSLKGSSDLSILFPSILRKTRVNFIDCKGLDQDALRIILKNGIQKFPDTLTESSPRPSAYICFPGTEIPEWFDFQNMGSSINIKPASGGLNTRLVSFAVCAIVDFQNYHDEGQGLVVGCDCKLGGRERSLVLYYDIGHHYSCSDHVFLGYDLHTCSFDLDDSQYNDNNEVSIQIYVEDSNAKRIGDCEVKKCGFHLLCYQEEPFCESEPMPYRGKMPLSDPFVALVDDLMEAARPYMLKTLWKLLQSILHLILTVRGQQKGKLNRDLDQLKVEDALVEILEQGKKYVERCSTVTRLNSFKKHRYTKKLQKLCSSVFMFFPLDKQAQNTRDSNVLARMEEVNRVNIDSQVELKEQKENLFKKLMNQTGITGPCSAPDPPEFFIGLDDLLKDIKKDLLKEGMQVIIVSAPGGYGKTALVRKLCKDDKVIAKFKDNIFYITVSATPNVELIVQKIFQHKKLPEPKFQTNEEAINELEKLLNKIGSEAILLVLDDIWRGSESLLQKIMLQLPDYKILVTSRYKFPQFGSGYNLEPLKEEDAVKLFCHSAIIPDEDSYKPDESIVNKLVKACKRSPLVLTVVGRSLRGQPEAVWKKRSEDLTKDATILIFDNEILNHLQSSLDVLDDEIKECFMDLGSFPEDQRIPATALIDMWRESYKLDEDLDVIFNLFELSNQSLVNLEVTRKDSRDDGFYNDYFVTQHDLLRQLIIDQSKLEPIEKRERIFIEIKENDFDKWWLEQKQHPVKARLVSITTDEKFSSNWLDVEAPEVEVVVLNIRSEEYTLPNFMGKMEKMKVLIVTNNGFFHAELGNFQLLGLLPDLKRIRLERVSIPSFDMTTMQMKNLQKISLHICNVGQIFRNSTFHISYTCPNLKEIDIDYCNDLEKLPDELCEIVSITKLSITNCHKLSALPDEIDKLVNLQVLILASCTDLKELPVTIGTLSNLKFLDISECLKIQELPTEIGGCSSLETLCMQGCSGCELPGSITNLKNLKVVKCCEETASKWKHLEVQLPTLEIKTIEEDTNAFMSRLGW